MRGGRAVPPRCGPSLPVPLGCALDERAFPLDFAGDVVPGFHIGFGKDGEQNFAVGAEPVVLDEDAAVRMDESVRVRNAVAFVEQKPAAPALPFVGGEEKQLLLRWGRSVGDTPEQGGPPPERPLAAFIPYDRLRAHGEILLAVFTEADVEAGYDVSGKVESETPAHPRAQPSGTGSDGPHRRKETRRPRPGNYEIQDSLTGGAPVFVLSRLPAINREPVPQHPSCSTVQ